MKWMTGLIALPLVSLATLTQPAQGQQTTPDAATVAIPPVACEKPADFMPTFDTKEQLTRFQKKLAVYKTCVDDYVKVNGDKANALVAQARAYNEAANKAVTDYNAYMTDLNQQSQGGSDKPNVPKVPTQ